MTAARRDSLPLLRSLLGAYQRMQVELQAMRREPATLRERLAMASINAELESGIAACRARIARRKAERGWGHLAHGTTHATPERARARQAPRRGAAEAGEAGVPGAEPSAAMGHGRPAFPRAGSAAGVGVRSEDAEAVGGRPAPP